MFDQKMTEYLIDQKSWKNALDHKIVLINLDWEVKEVLFDIVKRKSTPSDIITTLKDKYWGEDTPEINQLIEDIKLMMKPGTDNNNVHTEEEVEEVMELTNDTNVEPATTLDKTKCLHVIYCTARSQFLVEYYNLSITELNNSYDNHLNMISNKLNTMTDNAIIGFIEINCTLESIDNNSIAALYIQNVATETNNTVTNQSNESNQVDTVTPIKLNKQKEKVLLKGYMGKGFEGYDGQQFKYKDIDFYLVKSSSGWCIVEKTTKLYAVTWRKQRKQVFTEFEQFMSKRYEKVKEHIDKKKTEVS